MSRIVVCLMVLCLSLAGCMHHRLGYNTVRQAQTVSDVHTQQVLDNVAKFVHNRHALPHFSYPNQGGASVRDSHGGDAGFKFTPARLMEWDFGFDGSHQDDESYTMTPINDPEKLALMRCAYQRAISSCNCIAESESCPNCEKRFNRFYLGSTSTTQVGAVTADNRSIYRVNPNVQLIYFPNPSEPESPEKLKKDSGYVHYVVAERDENNKVIYTYLGSQNLTDLTEEHFIRLGTPVFKLDALTIEPTTTNELIELIEKASRENLNFQLYKLLNGKEKS